MVDDVTNFEIYLPSTSKAMADGEKEGKVEIQKFEYVKNEKSFLDEIKSILHSFANFPIYPLLLFRSNYI